MVKKRGALAKISPPRVHDVLVRTRLFGVLDKAGQRPVVWLSARPGAGKTTLVASYLEARKRPGIWYQLDDADADPASFIYHLRLAAQDFGGARAPLLPLLTPEYVRDLGGFARRFFRALFALLGPEATLVLDNFQDVADTSEFHPLLATAMGEVPAGVSVFVLSRTEPGGAYAPVLADNAIELVPGTALSLTLAETRAIARKRGVQAEPAVQALHERSQGWAAGLTLLLVRAQSQGGGQALDAESLQHVFGYFAQRVFDRISPLEQRALIELSVLPAITLDLADRLTGLAGVDRLLDHYSKRHLFTDRRRVGAGSPEMSGQAQAGDVFQFHDLFRTFLQHRARAVLSEAERLDLVRRAGHLLADAGQWEAALALLADAGDWDSYGSVIAAHAESLLAQGRQQSVTDWLARLPKEARLRAPWLLYWEGRAAMQGGSDRAMAVLQAGYRAFAAAADAAGQVACGAAIVQTLWYARLGWSEIAPWVDRLEPLMGEHVRFPSRAVELLTYSAVHAALAFCRPAHPAIPEVARRLLGLVDDPGIDWNQRLSTATHLMTYLHNAAEHELATLLIGKVDAAVETLAASALNRAFWFVFRAIHDVRQATYEQAAQRFQRAEDLARVEGLAHAEFAAIQFRAYMDVLFRRAADAEARVARLEVHPARGHPDAEMNFFVVRTLLAQLKGDRAAASANAQRALEAIRKVNAEYFDAVYPVLLSSAFADAGQPGQAQAIIANSRRIARGSYLEVMEAQLLLEEAYLCHVQGDAAGARTKLASGLGLAARDRSRAAYAHRIAARKPELLLLALQENIEVEFARTLIRQWRIPAPPQEPAQWPWPVKVRTLGGFEVRVDDAPVEFGRKAPKKTLGLLKAIIARGGSAPDGTSDRRVLAGRRRRRCGPVARRDGATAARAARRERGGGAAGQADLARSNARMGGCMGIRAGPCRHAHRAGALSVWRRLPA
jgi:tetratricopeptide (TPR) repeat protein